jgi:hypothetical protein
MRQTAFNSAPPCLRGDSPCGSSSHYAIRESRRLPINLPIRTPLLTLWLALAVLTAHAQRLSVTPHVLPSGGGLSTSPRFAITGSFGQPTAANELSPGAPLNLRSGFWANVIRWFNAPPSATPDLVSRRPGEGAHVLIRQLLANDVDPDFDTLSLSGFDTTSTLGGTVYRDGPWLIYQPPAAAGPTAEDTFSYQFTDGTAAPITGTVRLGPFLPSSSGPPNALAIVLDPGPPAMVRLRFQGIARRSYLVQAAPNPSGPWTQLGSVTAAFNGRVDYTDAPSQDPRFYRLAEP